MSSINMKKRGKWSEEDMKKAIQLLLKDKISQREAAQKYHLPRTTLRHRLQALHSGEEVNFHPQMGRFKMTFDAELEKQLVTYVRDLDNKLMPFNRNEFKKFAYGLAEYLKLPHQFNKESKSAGVSFYYGFMTRHPELSLRNFSSSIFSNSQGTLESNKNQMHCLFIKYLELINKYNFNCDKIYNCCEIRVPITTTNNNNTPLQGTGENVIFMLIINAAGSIFVPPLFIFPLKESVNEVLKKDAPLGSIVVSEEKGLISRNSFKQWLKLFVEITHPTREAPVLLILEVQISHKDVDILLYAREHHVHMFNLPSKLQPLERAIMESFRTAYYRACSMFNIQKGEIHLEDISGLVGKAYKSICKMDLAQYAFKFSGLWPTDSAAFTNIDFNPSQYYKKSEYIITASLQLNKEPEPSTEDIQPLGQPYKESQPVFDDPLLKEAHEVVSLVHSILK